MARQVDAGWKTRYGYSLEEVSLQSQTREARTRSSLASTAKAGTTPIAGFFEMEDTVEGPGLVILNATNSDLPCVTALAASGCNVTIFTTGRGTPVGSPASITLKVTATRRTAERMPENIDFSAADVVDERETLDEAAGRLVQAVVDAANGKPSCSETLRHWEVGIPIRGVTY
jgi:altronate dehydratase large subunit